MGGGGLPTGRVILHQPRPGGPLGGVADLAPYSAGGQRLALAPVRFGPGPGGSTAVSTLVQLDGPFPNGRVSALRLPVEGRLGPGGNFSVGTVCAVVAFNFLQMSSLQLGPTRLPICPIGPAIISKHDGGPLLASARLISPVVSGSLGSSPFHLAAANGQISGKELAFNSVGLRLGKSATPILLDASRLSGSFAGSNLKGAFSGAKATIGNVPLLLNNAAGSWSYRNKDLSVDGALTVSDAEFEPALLSASKQRCSSDHRGRLCRSFGLAPPARYRHLDHQRQHRAPTLDRCWASVAGRAWDHVRPEPPTGPAHSA